MPATATLDLEGAAVALESADAEQVVEWALAALADRYVVACSFQAGSLCVVDMVRRRGGRPRVLFLDTGFHFTETLAFRDEVAGRWDLDVIDAQGPGARGVQEAEHGLDLMRRDPDRCCQLNKVAPLRSALTQVDGWLTGRRREESAGRATAAVVEPYPVPDGRLIAKVNPIARWSRRDLWHYVREHDVPVHPLFDRGYLSIGCAPCTRPVAPGEDPRAGRWAGSGKTECGIHVVPPPAIAADDVGT